MNLFDIVSPMTIEEVKKSVTESPVEKGRNVFSGMHDPAPIGTFAYDQAQKKKKSTVSMPVGHKPGWALDPATKLKLKQQHRARNRVGVDEDAWHAGDNAWSSDQHEMFEGHSFSNGDQVELKPEYADHAGEVYTVSQCDVERGRCWVGDEDGRGWYANFNQLIPSLGQEEMAEDGEGTPEGVPHLTTELLQHIVDQVGSEGAHAIVKSVEWGDGAAEELLALILKDLKADIGDEEIAEHIGRVKDGYRLYSHKGKNLGTFPSKAGAEKRERQVQYFKHAGESVEEGSETFRNKIRDALWYAYQNDPMMPPESHEHSPEDMGEDEYEDFEENVDEILEFALANNITNANLAVAKYDSERSPHLAHLDPVHEGFQDFNRVEPYAVCLAGKPVKKFDYYEDARRFHDNWKQKLYREGDQAKADTITLMPLNLDEAMNKNDLLGNVAKDLNTQFKKAKSGKLKASGDFTKGDHWQGAKPGDYGYTGYQGHGMPTDKAERDRIRADKKKGVAEDWIDDDAAEPLAKYFADLYYGDFSVTMKVKLAAHIYQSIQDGKLSIEQLKADIDMLEKEKGITEGGIGDEIKHGIKGIKRKVAGKPSRQDVKDKYWAKSLTARSAGDNAEADKNAHRYATVHNNTNSGKVNEQGVAEAEEDTDDILQSLTSAYRACVDHRDSYANFNDIQTVYELLRSPLIKGDASGYKQMHKYVAGRYPDAFDALMDYVHSDQDVAEGSNEMDDYSKQFYKNKLIRLKAQAKRDAEVSAKFSPEKNKESKNKGVAEGSNDTYDIIRTNDYGKKDFFAGNYSLEQAKDELAKCLAHPLHTKYGHKFAIVKRNEQGVAEASYINGHVEDPESLRWKQTSMSYEQAVAKFGKNNVKQDGKNRLGQKIVMVLVPLGEQGVAEGSFAHDQLKGEINDLFKPVVLQIVKWARAEGMTAKDLAGTSSHFFLDALDPDTYDRTQHLPDNYFNKLMDKANAKAVEILKKKGVAEADPNAPYTPSPAKPFRNPRGFNKQGTGVGNKLAQQTRAELANIQPSKGTPVPAKNFAQGVLKDLKKVNVKESYWTKLQNERNTKLNSLVNELKESVNK